MKNDIALLKKVFTYGNATNTHLDILDYLNHLGVSKSEYSKWGHNASQPAVEADTQKPCSSVETCEIHYDTGNSACVDCPIRTA